VLSLLGKRINLAWSDAAREAALEARRHLALADKSKAAGDAEGFHNNMGAYYEAQANKSRAEGDQDSYYTHKRMQSKHEIAAINSPSLPSTAAQQIPQQKEESQKSSNDLGSTLDNALKDASGLGVLGVSADRGASNAEKLRSLSNLDVHAFDPLMNRGVPVHNEHLRALNDSLGLIEKNPRMMPFEKARITQRLDTNKSNLKSAIGMLRKHGQSKFADFYEKHGNAINDALRAKV
jgi:hypothetical protein